MFILLWTRELQLNTKKSDIPSCRLGTEIKNKNMLNEQKDLMNKAGELFEKDYNIFLHFGVAGLYFLMISIVLFWLAGLVQKRLNKHITAAPSISLKQKLLSVTHAFIR